MKPRDLLYIRPKLRRAFQSAKDAPLSPTMLSLLAQLREAERDVASRRQSSRGTPLPPRNDDADKE
jgi:hypothetical protein